MRFYEICKKYPVENMRMNLWILPLGEGEILS